MVAAPPGDGPIRTADGTVLRPSRTALERAVSESIHQCTQLSQSTVPYPVSPLTAVVHTPHLEYSHRDEQDPKRRREE